MSLSLQAVTQHIGKQSLAKVAAVMVGEITTAANDAEGGSGNAGNSCGALGGGGGGRVQYVCMAESSLAGKNYTIRL